MIPRPGNFADIASEAKMKGGLPAGSNCSTYVIRCNL